MSLAAQRARLADLEAQLAALEAPQPGDDRDAIPYDTQAEQLTVAAQAIVLPEIPDLARYADGVVELKRKLTAAEKAPAVRLLAIVERIAARLPLEG
jgi:hypothetical protein